MATVRFTENLRRHLDCPTVEVSASTARDAIHQACEQVAGLRGYILDDQGALRKHVVVFVDGRAVVDRVGLSDEIENTSEVYVMQALSGG